MLKLRTAALLSPALLLLAVGTGCGTQSGYLNHHGTHNLKDSGQSNDGSGSSDPAATATGAIIKGVPPYSFNVTGVGYNSTNVQVKTRSILKIKFTPGTANQMVSGTGYTARYTALGVFIQVGTTTNPTPLLSNGYPSGKAETSAVMDYSSAITSTCAASDTTCHQTVSIIVKQPNSDDACWWYNNEQFGCTDGSYFHQMDGHPWNGTLTVQTDDTDSI